MISLSTMLKAPGAMLECDDDPEAVYELLCEKGLSDGLPVIPTPDADVIQPIARRRPDRNERDVPPIFAGDLDVAGKVLELQGAAR